MLDDVAREAGRADQKYGPFTSAHEGYGVLAEEVWELLEAIRLNNRAFVKGEAIQVAAVALRIANACDLSDFCERSGFK